MKRMLVVGRIGDAHARTDLHGIDVPMHVVQPEAQVQRPMLIGFELILNPELFPISNNPAIGIAGQDPARRLTMFMMVMHIVLLVRSILVLLVRSILVLFFTGKRKQSGFVGYRRPINLEPGFNRVSRIHHVGVIQPHAAGNSPPVLISRGKRFFFVLGIGQNVIRIGRKRRPAVPEVAGHAEKLIRIHVVPPHQMGVLVMFLLVFINGFRRLRHKLWVGVVPDQFFNLFVRRQTRLRGNLIVRHAVQEQPRDVVAVVELVVPTQEGLVSLAVAVKDGLPQRGRINPPIGL